MENRKFTITSTQLNTTTDNIIDTYIEKTSGYNQVETTRWYPVKIQLINKSGIDVLFNIIASWDEYQLYLATPANYVGFTVQAGTTVNLSSINILPFAYKCIVTGTAATASGDFNIECIQYVPKM